MNTLLRELGWFVNPTPTETVGREVDSQVAAPTGSKITTLVLDWVVLDLVVRFDSRAFGVAGSFSKCAFASIVW
jgi:hypothetical protein